MNAVVELASTATPFLADLAAGLIARSGPRWAELRRRGLAIHERLGIPTVREEEWKYTSLRAVAEQRWDRAPMAEVGSIATTDLPYASLDQVRLVVANGRFAPEISSELPVGVTLTRLGEHEGELAGTLAPLEEFTFGAMNTAAFEDGLELRIGRNVIVDRPIHLVFFSDARAGSNFVTFPRLAVIAEESSQALILESYVTLGEGATWTIPVVEMTVAPNASLEHVKLQAERLDAVHIALTQIKQAPDSSYNGYSVTYGGGLTRNDLNVYLDGSNVHSRMDGVVVLRGDQHADNHTRLDHALPHCDSFEVYKHVLDDRSRAVFNGKIFVHQDAQKTDAKQTNQTLLLSREAQVDTKPQLEIFADDVKCTHGATIGRVREDAMFYLRARGIPKLEARSLLVYAFAAEVLEKISHEGVVAELEARLYDKLRH